MTEPYRYLLNISGCSICLETDQLLPMEEAFLPFVCEQEPPCYCAVFRRTEHLPALPDQVLHEARCFRVHQTGEQSVTSFFNAPRGDRTYAVVSGDYPRGIIHVDYLDFGKQFVSELSNSFFHLGFERLLVRERRLCFHAACVRTELGGLLFSGPSGIGKSTQAELWCRYRKSKLINGDRPILSNEGGTWLAWGSPYAGSSRCYVNENCSVTAIVMLRQAPVCSLNRLNTAQAFRKVYAGLTVNSWDRDFVTKACDLAMELVSQVPVFEFGCTPDEQAVDYLERRLREELTP